MIPIKYFFISMAFIYLFSFILTIFGKYVLKFILRQRKIPNFSLKTILVSFGVGISIFLSYAMIIVSFKIFKFVTIYLPFIILDLIFILKDSFGKNSIFKKFISSLKKEIIIPFIKKHYKDFIIILIILILQISFQLTFLNSYLALPAYDPYYWFRNIMSLLSSGMMNYTYISAYTPGFVLFCSATLLPVKDYYFIFYFMKYIPIFFMTINLFALLEISNSIFIKLLAF